MQLCIIAGSGNLPLQLAKENKDAFVLCIDEHSHSKLFENKSASVSLLNPDSWIDILKLNNITHIIMVGKINRPKVITQKLSKNDETLINKINSLGDNLALNLIEDFFKNHGFHILPLSSFLQDCSLPKGFYPEKKIFPSFQKYILDSAEVGINLLNTISRFDVGQSAVVSSKLVYAIEGQEGTDCMIDRAGSLSNKNKLIKHPGPVLIKIPKINQNINLDPPVIGFETVRKCIENNFSSLVVSSNGTIIFELKKIMNLINKKNFVIYVV